MFKVMDRMVLAAKGRLDCFVNRLLYEEKGAADIVAILVVIVIVMAVAITFRDQLQVFISTVFTKATSWVNEQ